MTVQPFRPAAISAKPAQETLTEDTAARTFAECYFGRLRYDHHRGRWFRWDRNKWAIDETETAFQRVREHARAMGARISERADRDASRVQFVQHVERFARGDTKLATTSDGWDRDPWLLGTPGGTVDLRTGELGPSDPEDGISRNTSVAPAAEADCPRWLQFIDEVTSGDAGYARFLAQVAGYSLTGVTTEHALFYAHGPGGNGKSVFENVLTGILADYATTASMDVFVQSGGDRHPTELARLRGARLVAASETEEGRAWAEARIKGLTGGDRIAARFMKQDFFEYVPQFKLLIVGNHKPVLRNVDDAARRRFNLLPFVFRPATPDTDLQLKLDAEAAGILRWAINGGLDWQKHGLIRPDVVKVATAGYFDEQDLLGQFLEEECEVEPGNQWKSERSSDVFTRWTEYAKAAGESVGSKRSFADRLRHRGIEPQKGTGGVRMLRGIRLRHRQAIEDEQ